MKLQRLLELAGLAETITDNPEQNDQILALLDTMPENLRTPMLDALEIVYMAGTPITIQDWATQFAALHPSENPGEVLKQTAKTFQNFIKRVAPKTYAWQPTPAEQLDPDYAPISQAVDLASATVAAMRELGTFTLYELTKKVSDKMAVNPQDILPYIVNTLQGFSGQITKQGDVYTFNQEKRTSGMQTIKNLLNKPPSSDAV